MIGAAPLFRDRHRRRGLLVPAPDAPLFMWNGWRVHEDSIDGTLAGDHVLLLPPRFYIDQAREVLRILREGRVECSRS